MKDNEIKTYSQTELNYNDTFTALFDELYEALNQYPNLVDVYKGYTSVMYRLLISNTQFTTIKFKGTYSKVAYLLKEYNANNYLKRIVNDMRIRIKIFRDTKDKQNDKLTVELKENYLYDFEALCKFISLVYNCQIPERYKELFLPIRKLKDYGKLIDNKAYLRMIVEHWDQSYLYGTINDYVEDVKVSYNHSYNNKASCCWSYLNEYLYENCQLNLVRPRIKDGIIIPELIILEPDNLINISDIASCFQSFATTHLNNIIKKLQPSPQTEAILLGNLAGQLLDEEINTLTTQQSYQESAKKFFKKSAFNLIATKVSPDFHNEAKRQQLNINNAFKELPSAVKEYDRNKVILEPSFFSQILGMQGRMDLIQEDYKFIIEQKSGKSAFPAPARPDEEPKPQEQHYVQMLLYMALLKYNYGISFEDSSSFLLYSKYPKSLCRVATAPELIFKAIQIRNAIASTDEECSKGGFKILNEIDVQEFHVNNINQSYWDNYICPQLEQVLAPIHNASTLEKKYFYRMLTFVANEHLISKVGSNQKEDNSMSSIWLSTLEEKRESGNIFTDLQLISPTKDHKGSVSDIILRFEQREDNGMCNFRKGDIVILYPYRKDSNPEACNQIVNRCIITEIRPDTIMLHLRAQQSSNRLFLKDPCYCWAIEHDFMESSYSSQYRGIHSFLTAPQKRRDLLLMKHYPEYDESLTLNGEYGDFNNLALRVKQAKELFIIIGPPGTGKTSYGMLNTLKEELTNIKSSILIVSYTNRAVDEICGKLLEDNIDFIRLGNTFSSDESYHNNLLETKINNCNNINELKTEINQSRVIVGTTNSLSNNIGIFSLKQFNLLIIDEASQILEPHLLPILCAKFNNEPAIKKIVMIGDHKQLPAVVKQSSEESKVTDVDLNNIELQDCRLSLFERMLRRYGKDEHITYMLTKQGRMHRDIAMFPNFAFYENKLEVVPLSHQLIKLPTYVSGENGIKDILTTRRIIFIEVDSPEKEYYITDKVNQHEADIIAATVVNIYQMNAKKFDINTTVGIIVPYRNQISTVRNAIDKYGISQLHDITIDTVERYQGSQRDYIIYGFTIQKYYQLQFLTNNSFEENGTIIDRKLNVAMTRAKSHLILVGNSNLLVNDFTFYKLIEFIKSRHGYFNIPLNNYIKGNFKVESLNIKSDISDEIYTLSQNFYHVFQKFIIENIKQLPGTEWPYKILGREMTENLNSIGYGYSNFSNTSLININDELLPLSPDWQVLLYCYYIMRQHYCSSKNIYDSYSLKIRQEIKANNGRLHFIDIGCAPGTCGISFAENFLIDASKMLYIGIDVSSSMKNMALRLIDATFNGTLFTRFESSLNNLSEQYWENCSEAPSLIIFNISYFFSNVKADFTEQLGIRIKEIISKYPLNRYKIIIQHSEHDTKLNSYKGNHSIFRYDNFIGCFSADKIKKSVRK